MKRTTSSKSYAICSNLIPCLIIVKINWIDINKTPFILKIRFLQQPLIVSDRLFERFVRYMNITERSVGISDLCLSVTERSISVFDSFDHEWIFKSRKARKLRFQKIGFSGSDSGRVRRVGKTTQTRTRKPDLLFIK